MSHKRKRIFIAILMMFGASLCFAKQMSFQIVQHNNSATDVTEDIIYLEEEILNSFFESGYIVTNSLSSLSSSKSEDEKLYKIGITEAFEGGSDYFAQIILYYSDGENIDPEKKVMVLNKIKFSLRTVNDLKLIDEKSMKCNIDIVESIDILNISDTLIDALFEVLNA